MFCIYSTQRDALTNIVSQYFGLAQIRLALVRARRLQILVGLAKAPNVVFF